MKGIEDLGFFRLDKESFKTSPSDSIDYAVMEKTDIGVVITIEAGWNDLGSWDALWQIKITDLIKRVDAHIKQVADAYPDEITCHKGCDSCCRFLTLFPVEAFALSRAFTALSKTNQARIVKTIESLEISGAEEPEHCPPSH